MVTLAFSLKGKKVLIIGAGAVAERKLYAILDEEALITVAAPEVRSERISKLIRERRVTHTADAYQAGLMSGYSLVFAATDYREINDAVVKEGLGLGIPVNSAHGGGDFTLPASFKTGDITVNVSTAVNQPALAAALRDKLELEFDQNIQKLIPLLAAYRPRLLEVIRERQKDDNTMRKLCALLIDEAHRESSELEEMITDFLNNNK